MKSFKEEYVVKFQYQKEDGFYTTTTESVFVEIKENQEEKNSHTLAEKEIKKRGYKNLSIINVRYC